MNLLPDCELCRGPVYATPQTRDLLYHMLPDAVHILGSASVEIEVD